MDGFDGAKELFGVVCRYFVSFIFPPSILHDAEFTLNSGLAFLKSVVS